MTCFKFIYNIFKAKIVVFVYQVSHCNIQCCNTSLAQGPIADEALLPGHGDHVVFRGNYRIYS